MGKLADKLKAYIDHTERKKTTGKKKVEMDIDILYCGLRFLIFFILSDPQTYVSTAVLKRPDLL